MTAFGKRAVKLKPLLAIKSKLLDLASNPPLSKFATQSG